MLFNNRNILKRFLNFKRDSLRVIYYHMVSDVKHPYYFKNKGVTPDEFVFQIKLLKKFYTIVSIDDAIRMSHMGESLSNKLVITFDDGFKECSTIVAPILLEENISATFFLIGNCLNNHDLMWRNKLLLLENHSINSKLIDGISYEFNLKKIRKNESIMNWSRFWPMYMKELIVNRLWAESGIGSLNELLDEYKPYMSDKEVIGLLESGFEIGSHSMSHPFFSQLDYNQFYSEISDSIMLLEERYNTNVKTFSYPFGDRPSNLDYESRFIKEFNSVNLFLGTKNSLNNYHKYSFWGRDNLEFDNNEAVFRLTILPIIRNLKSKII